jgi:hypothetical protein
MLALGLRRVGRLGLRFGIIVTLVLYYCRILL